MPREGRSQKSRAHQVGASHHRWHPPGLLAGSVCACKSLQTLGGSLLSPSLCLLAVSSIKHRKLEPFIWLFVARSPRPGSLPCPLQPPRLAARPASLTPRSLVCLHFPFGPRKAPLRAGALINPLWEGRGSWALTQGFPMARFLYCPRSQLQTGAVGKLSGWRCPSTAPGLALLRLSWLALHQKNMVRGGRRGGGGGGLDSHHQAGG